MTKIHFLTLYIKLSSKIVKGVNLALLKDNETGDPILFFSKMSSYSA